MLSFIISSRTLLKVGYVGIIKSIDNKKATSINSLKHRLIVAPECWNYSRAFLFDAYSKITYRKIVTFSTTDILLDGLSPYLVSKSIHNCTSVFFCILNILIQYSQWPIIFPKPILVMSHMNSYKAFCKYICSNNVTTCFWLRLVCRLDQETQLTSYEPIMNWLSTHLFYLFTNDLSVWLIKILI